MVAIVHILGQGHACAQREWFLERMHLQGSDTPTTMPHMHAN